MSGRPTAASGAGRGMTMGAGAAVLLVIIVPLFREFYEPGETVWNILLVIMLLGLAVGAFLLQLYLPDHAGEMGEARFDTRNKGGADG